jgi:hypothetical protein
VTTYSNGSASNIKAAADRLSKSKKNLGSSNIMVNVNINHVPPPAQEVAHPAYF